MQEIVHFKEVTFSYPEGTPIFEKVSFSLLKGSFHYLTGISGAGKSTLIKLLYGELKQNTGRIEVFGQDLSKLQRTSMALYRQRLGIVFQDFLLFEHLSALDNIALPLKIRGESSHQARSKARELLEWIGLKGLEDMMPKKLSGGQQQRLAIARAVISRPSLVIADEPTGNVDDENAVKLLQLFAALNASGITVIFVTHNRDLIAEFPYPVLHLENQKIMKISSSSLFGNHLHA